MTNDDTDHPVPVDADTFAAEVRRIRTGAAPIARIFPVPAQVPARGQPDKMMVATVPFLAVPVVPWSKATSGEPLGHLMKLLQHHGGVWLAKNITTTADWTVSPPRVGTNQQTHAYGRWIRLDMTINGAWNGTFALAARADLHAPHLWTIAASPLIAVLPDEIADDALAVRRLGETVTWKQFKHFLDDTLHTAITPPSSIGQLVTQAGWPGADKTATL